jgi:hypothetical protein
MRVTHRRRLHAPAYVALVSDDGKSFIWLDHWFDENLSDNHARALAGGIQDRGGLPRHQNA